MRTDEKNNKHLIADDGKILVRKSDGFVAGKEFWLGMTYYLNGELLGTPFEELPEHYEEVDAPEEVVEVLPEEYGTPEGDAVLLDEEHPMVVEAERVTEDGRPEGDGNRPTVITAGDIRTLQRRVKELEQMVADMQGRPRNITMP